MKKLIIGVVLALALMPASVANGSEPEWNNRDGIEFVQSVHRFWSSSYRGHFYTSNSSEASNVISTMPEWSYEGELFYVYHPAICDGAPPGLCIPVYRFWSNTYKHHFYTISELERNFVQNTMPEWQYEGVAYAANTDPSGGDPLFRFWSNTYRGHFYTSSVAERNFVQNTMPEWQYEGIAYYVYNTYPFPE